MADWVGVDVTDRTCTVESCERPHHSKGMCKPCYRKDYYQRNRERELAGMKQWRTENYEYDRARWAEYAEQRWGDAKRAREAEIAAWIAAPDKQCTKCGEVKPKSEFYADKRHTDGLYFWCKTCFTAHNIATRDPAVEAVRRSIRRARPGALERERDKGRRWREANPERARATVRKRQARQAGATVEDVDYRVVLRQHGMHCYLCDAGIESLDDLDFDHMVPLTRGGDHSYANIRPAHARCNRRKHAKTVEEYREYVRRQIEVAEARGLTVTVGDLSDEPDLDLDAIEEGQLSLL